MATARTLNRENQHPNAARPEPRTRRVLSCLLLTSMTCATLAVAGGCQRTLFRDRDPRTQFEGFDAMRGDVAPRTKPDVFGNPQPALRERLGS